MTTKYFVYEFRHCSHTWRGLSERSRCRGCRVMVRAWSKELVNGPESKAEFVNKFKEVFSDV